MDGPRPDRAWWRVPMLIGFGLLGLVGVPLLVQQILGATGEAPFIYSLK